MKIEDFHGGLRVSSGAPWEGIVGYSRAICRGNMIWVSGTAPVLEGKVAGGDDAHAQAIVCLQIIEAALMAVGATLKDVVRTRMFVTDISEWEAIGRAHGLFFGEIRPATTMVQVAALIDPAMKVEIEAEAWMGRD